MEADIDHLISIFTLLSIPLQTSAFGAGVIIGILLVIILLVCSAMISSSEVAFFSLTPNDIKDLNEENSIVSDQILLLRERPRILLATILISNNFINIAIVIVSDFILRTILPTGIFDQWSAFVLERLPLKFTTVEGLSGFINLMITVVGVTFLLVLFGEVAPKVYAKINNMKLAKMMASTLLGLRKVFYPVGNLLVQGTNMIEKRLAKSAQNGTITSREDIDQAIELTVRDEKHAEHDIDILKGIVKFGDVSVKQIMCARVDVVAVDFRIDFHELLSVVRESGYSRIPVYDENFDTLTGILYVKDLLGYLDESIGFEWQELIRPKIFYVPEAKKIKDLLKEFQEQRLHMAIVVDEFGGSSGIVTLEDVLEEIIGDIKDEFDEESEVDFTKIDERNYVFEGKTLLNDVCRIVGIDTTTFDESRGDADSLAGLVLELLGHIPKTEIELNYNEYSFKIVSVNKRRIEQIQITLPKPEVDEPVQ